MTLGGASANYFTVNGFTWRHLVAASAAGAGFSIGLISLLLGETGHWVAGQGDQRIVYAVSSTGVDITALSAADLAARLSLETDEGRLFVAAIGDGLKPVLDDLARWLRTMEPERRRQALQNLMLLSSAMGNSWDKFRLSQGILGIDEPTAHALAGVRNFSELLRKLGAVPPTLRQDLIDADFPVRPYDEVRAHLWGVINSAFFPASDLVGPLSELARAHSSRLEAIRAYIDGGTPLPKCGPVACAPVACQAPSTRGYTCEQNYYLTEQLVCISYQGRKK